MFILNRKGNRCIKIKEVSFEVITENWFSLKINGETFETFNNTQKGQKVFQEILNKINDNVKFYKVPHEYEVK